MNICDRCGKGVQVGMNVSHSHVRTKKRSKPNLHHFRLKQGDVTRRLRLCTKCLRVVKKEASRAKSSIPQEAKEPAATLSEDIQKAASKTQKEPAETPQA